MISCEKILAPWEEEEEEIVIPWEEEETETNDFVINSDVLADWGIRKIKEAQAEHDRLVALAEEEIENLKETIKSLDEKLENKTGFLKGKLYEYFNTVDHKKTKTQESYKLLNGSLVFKNPSQKMVPNKEKLLEYVKDNGMSDFVKVKEEVDWAAYKKECEIHDGRIVNTQTGDLLPDDVIGVEDVSGEFSIK